MKIPKNIKVGGIMYEVIRNQKRLKNGNTVWGEISYKETTIELIEGLKDDLEQASFIHELIHAMLWHVGITDHDEVVIEKWAAAVYAFIVDNPEMFKE